MRFLGLITALKVIFLANSKVCQAGGVISVVAPQLAQSVDSKEPPDPRPKTTRFHADRWWYGALERGLATQAKLASEQEYELKNYLFNEQGYNPLIRPVANIFDALRVDLGLCMIKIIHIDEKRQVMKSNVWLPMVWRDYQLTWDPAKYGGLKVLRVPHNHVWKPDIVLFNNADGNYEVVWRPNLLLHHDGSILWMPPAVYESSCTINVEYFPFDEQECEMKFGSWAFDASRISMGFYSNLEFVDLSDYWRSGTWDIVDVPARIVNTSSGEANNTYIVYAIKLRRKTLFYTVNLIVPCVMLSLLSIFVFYLPSDAGEKVTLAISIVVALVVFLILVSKILPPTSSTVPLISRYLVFTFVSDVFAVFMAVVVVNWNYPPPRTRKMPPRIRVLFLRILPRLLFMNLLEPLDDKELDDFSERRHPPQFFLSEENRDAFIQEFPECTTLDLVSNLTMDSNEHAEAQVYENLRSQCITPSEGPSSPSSSVSSSSTNGNNFTIIDCGIKIRKLKHSPRRIGKDKLRKCKEPVPSSSERESGPSLLESLKAIDYIAEKLEEKHRNRMVVQEWKYAASVIDRLLLFVYSITSVLVALSIFTNAPSLLSPVDQDEVINKYSVLKKS